MQIARWRCRNGDCNGAGVMGPHAIGLVLSHGHAQARADPSPAAACGAPDESDVMELVEMILGALGSDALGMGDSMAHPARSEEWTSLSFEERMEFFAPIWRIMRDENMTTAQVWIPLSMHPSHALSPGS